MIDKIILYVAFAILFGVWLAAVIGCWTTRDRKLPVIVILLLLCACTPRNQSNTPVYNVTNNTQIVVGDNNSTHTDTGIESDTTADATSKNTTSNMWILWLILIVAGVTGVYVIGKKKGLL